MLQPTYWTAVEAARNLLSEQIRDPEGEANPEYERGICELLSDLYGRQGRESVRQDIGLDDRRDEGEGQPLDYVAPEV